MGYKIVLPQTGDVWSKEMDSLSKILRGFAVDVVLPDQFMFLSEYSVTELRFLGRIFKLA